MSARHYPLHFIIDTDGTPLVGGTVTSFVAGSSTPKKIYPTRADAIADTNGSTSVTLGSDGGIIVWFDDATKLKLVLKDSSGSVIPNGTIDDISGEQDVNPANLTLGGVLNLAQSTNLASAATTDIATGATGNYIVITGTTTITAFGTVQAGAMRLLEFAASLTLTHNATSLILPDGVNIVTKVGDLCEMLSLGSGNWKCTRYLRKQEYGDSVASATTTDLSTATGSVVDIAGTTTITGLGTAEVGVTKRLRFTNTLTFTHNAVSLIIPGGASITTAVGDIADVVSLGSGNWYVANYTKANGQPLVGAPYVGLALDGADIGSASTVDLSTATGTVVKITGTTTITSFGTVAAGKMFVLKFAAALTITHNATSMILPGAQSILTVAGDVLVFLSLGSGNWQLAAGRIPVDGNHLNIKGADIASATTTDLNAATGDFVDVTGTTTITSFGTMAAGVEKTIRFTGILTVTHNATSLISPTRANIVTMAGEIIRVRSLGSGNWLITDYEPIATGVLVQRIWVQISAVASTSTAMPCDDTIPQITEGAEFFSQAITPKKSTNRLELEVNMMLSSAVNTNIAIAFFQDATSNALAAMGGVNTAAGNLGSNKLRHSMTAGTTSSTTFRVRAGASGASQITMNGAAGSRLLGGVAASNFTISEYSV